MEHDRWQVHYHGRAAHLNFPFSTAPVHLVQPEPGVVSSAMAREDREARERLEAEAAAEAYMQELRQEHPELVEAERMIFADTGGEVIVISSEDEVEGSEDGGEWFTEHPDYLPNPFYVGGDSAGGKIVPFLAQKISEDIEAGVRPLINLKGYLVGNPGTGESIDYASRVPFLHGMGIISDQLYETIMGHCQGEDYNNPKNVLCAQALYRFSQLWNEISHPHILYKRCVYTSSGPGNGDAERKILKEETGVLKHQPPRPPMDCQTYGNYLSYFWANNNLTRKALGIKKGSKGEWVRCHERDLPYSLDIKSTIKYHRNMTLRGYRALVYSGDHDSVVPFLGTQSWVRSLNFPIVDEWRAWHLDGQSAGFTITYTNNLTFATVKNGGHTAPEFEPERCLAMFARWVSHESL